MERPYVDPNRWNEDRRDSSPRSLPPARPEVELGQRLRSYGRRVARYWPTAAVVAGTCSLVAALALPRIVKPVYRSESVLLFRDSVQASYLGHQSEAGDRSKRIGPRLKDLLLARSRLEGVIHQFDLYPRTVAREGLVDAVEELRSHIDFRAREGDTFHVSFDSESPETAFQVTSVLATGLIEENARLRAEEASSAKDFLNEQKRLADDDLRGKERQLAMFLAEHPEFADETGGKGGPSAGASVRAAQKKEQDLRTQTGAASPGALLLALERQAARLRERIKNPSAPAPVMTVAGPVDPRLLAQKNEAEAQLAAAQKDLADRQTRFTDQHPDVLAARAKVRAAEERAQAAREALAQPAPAPARPDAEPAAEADVGALSAQLARVERDIVALRNGQKRAESAAPTEPNVSESANGIVSLETTWSRLNRDVLEARERNQQLLDRLFKASMNASVESSGGAAEMQLVDPAFRPVRPVSFGRNRVMAAGVGVALLIGLLAAILRALLDDRLYDELDLGRLDLPLLPGWIGPEPLVAVVPRGARRKS